MKTALHSTAANHKAHTMPSRSYIHHMLKVIIIRNIGLSMPLNNTNQDTEYIMPQ